jgi:hypothetical protein
VLVAEERARRDSVTDGPFGFENESNPIRARLIAAAAALGIGRAAVAHALAFMKAHDVKAGPETTVPHWAFGRWRDRGRGRALADLFRRSSDRSW